MQCNVTECNGIHLGSSVVVSKFKVYVRICACVVNIAGIGAVLTGVYEMGSLGVELHYIVLYLGFRLFKLVIFGFASYLSRVLQDSCACRHATVSLKS